MLISCPDQKGITATVTNFIYQNNGNIVHADQHIDSQSNTFFMRLEWQLDGFLIPQDLIGQRFQAIAQKFDMKWELFFSDQLPRVAILVSRHLHCLYDLLLRHKEGQLRCEIPLIISNHAEGKGVAEQFSVPYEEVVITKENKLHQEERELKILQDLKIDFVVLARYHQILSKQFVSAYKNRIINIHHSFLPAFPGKNPYAKAYQKGVKIIGATSHFVTEELDEGAIIEQDTVRISHTDSLNDLIRKGHDLEKMVLYRAVRWALERKILSYSNKTVVFD